MVDKRSWVACLVPVRAVKMPETGAKRKLLDAAEKLVVEKGFDLVSVRDVTGAVKANVAAVNYHFGTREGMLDMVVARVLGPLCEARLKALGAREKDAGVDEIMNAFVSALNTTAAKMDMELPYFLNLAGRVAVLSVDSLPIELVMMRERVSEKFEKALSAALPELPSKEIEAGWRFFETGLGQALISLQEKEDAAEMLAYWSGFGAKGFCGNTTVTVVNKDDGQGMLFEF